MSEFPRCPYTSIGQRGASSDEDYRCRLIAGHVGPHNNGEWSWKTENTTPEYRIEVSR
jgi:hypothetical protein